MRRIYDRGEIPDAVHAKVRNARCSALIFFGLELTGLGTGGKLFDLVRDRCDTLRFRVPDDRRHQAARNRDRHSDVSMSMTQQRSFREGHVGIRHLIERQSQCPDDEIIHRQAVGSLAVTPRRRRIIELLSQRQQRIDACTPRTGKNAVSFVWIQTNAAQW